MSEGQTKKLILVIIFAIFMLPLVIILPLLMMPVGQLREAKGKIIYKLDKHCVGAPCCVLYIITDDRELATFRGVNTYCRDIYTKETEVAFTFRRNILGKILVENIYSATIPSLHSKYYPVTRLS